MTEAARGRLRGSILDRIAQAFRQRDPYYDARWTPLDARRKKLNGILADLLKKGHPMECALQHLYEAKWLINYTDDWVRAAAVLDACEESVGNVDQPRMVQDKEGSWGSCCTEWYRKLEPTIDALQEREAATDPLLPLSFMSFLQKPANAVGLLQAISVSDIVTTGRNCRDEQNALLTALGQLVFKDALRKLLTCRTELKFTVSKELEKAFVDYLWGLQQDDTGYWGPSYKFDDGIITVPDVSYTFHVVHYYMDGTTRTVPNLDKIVATTLAIRDEVYPNGWLEKDGNHSDHNNYDIVTLFDCGWQAATTAQREVIRDDIQALLDWCLTKSLNGDRFGTGKTIDGYYYGVRFLDRIGFWDKARCFWLDGDIPLPDGCLTPKEIRQNLLKGFEPIDDGSEYCETVRQILTGVMPPPDACGRT